MYITYKLILLTPLLFLIFYFINKSRNALEINSIFLLSNLKPSLKIIFRKYVLNLLFLLGILSLAIGASKPVENKNVKKEIERRNLMLCIDISKSMLSRDFSYKRQIVTRIQAVKAVLKDFIKARKGDRIGLVIFASKAFLQAPLTIDHNALTRILSNIEVGLAGSETAIGDGLGLALKHIEKIEGKTSSIILLTDGLQTAGNVNALEVANIAKKLNIKIYSIGIGSGNIQQSFDQSTLKKIAMITNSSYFSPKNTSELNDVYKEINKIEKSLQNEEPLYYQEEYFYYAGSIALLVLWLYFLLSQTFLKIYPE